MIHLEVEKMKCAAPVETIDSPLVEANFTPYFSKWVSCAIVFRTVSNEKRFSVPARSETKYTLSLIHIGYESLKLPRGITSVLALDRLDPAIATA